MTPLRLPTYVPPLGSRQCTEAQTSSAAVVVDVENAALVFGAGGTRVVRVLVGQSKRHYTDGGTSDAHELMRAKVCGTEFYEISEGGLFLPLVNSLHKQQVDVVCT